MLRYQYRYIEKNNALPAFFLTSAVILGAGVGSWFTRENLKPFMTRIFTGALVVGLLLYLPPRTSFQFSLFILLTREYILFSKYMTKKYVLDLKEAMVTFEPVTIGNMKLKNRIICASKSMGIYNDNGSPTQELLNVKEDLHGTFEYI